MRCLIVFYLLQLLPYATPFTQLHTRRVSALKPATRGTTRIFTYASVEQGSAKPAGAPKPKGYILSNPKILVRIQQPREPRQPRGGGGSYDRRGSPGGGRGPQKVFNKPSVIPQDQPSTTTPGRRGAKAPPRKGAPVDPEKKKVQRWKKPVAQENKRFRGRASLKRKNRNQDKGVKEKETVFIPEGPVSVGTLSSTLDVKGPEVVKYLMMQMGILCSLTQTIDFPTARTVAVAFGKELKVEGDGGEEEEDDEGTSDTQDDGFAMDMDDPDTLEPRGPVVTIMGHVDHGKTSLLDAIRQADVVSGEAGGITQHIGAYSVMTARGDKVTFIDTPGHAAFSEMRQRGADVTDIVILVLAADDGVKNQTIEALNAARQAGKPVIVAFNKCDKPGADVNRVATELTGYDLLIEDLGGEILSAEVSAKTKSGLDELLEKVMLQAEVLDLKANYDRAAQGSIVEVRMQKGLGTVATTLIQRGTIRVGDFFIAGEANGKVRMLITDKGEKVTEAGPSMPVQIVGLDGVPLAGDTLLVGDDEGLLRDLAARRSKLAMEKSSVQFEGDLKNSVMERLTQMGDLQGEQLEEKEVHVCIKADVMGSAEALVTALKQLEMKNEIARVKVKVLLSGVGDVTQSDLAIADVSNAWTIAFNVATIYQAQEDARNKNLEIGYYSVVYDVLDEMEVRMKEVLSPTPEGDYTGKAEVKAIFDIGKVGKIAGCAVLDGEVLKSANFRVLRGPRIVHEGRLKTLKHVKEDVQSMSAGSECGVNFQDWEEMMEGDIIESYVMNV